MKFGIKKTLKFFGKEVILKYFFCYIISGIAFAIPLTFNIIEPWKSWLISFSASIFSLPVIFVIYNLYVTALEKRTQEKIFQRINDNVTSVFARFVYFTEYFYYNIEDKKKVNEAELNKILKYSSDEIFKLISDNVLSGIILFSEFDSFDDSINDIINEPIISEYANQKDIAILIDFVNSYKEFKDIFSFIRQDDYTVCGKYDNIELQESYYVKNDQGKLFYDAKKILSDTEVETFYTAIYPIYEETSILLKFKVSGMKAKEITNAIKNVYDCINKWIAIHSDSKLPISQAIVVSGRLYVDYDITYNEYMKNNISIRNQF